MYLKSKQNNVIPRDIQTNSIYSRIWNGTIRKFHFMPRLLISLSFFSFHIPLLLSFYFFFIFIFILVQSEVEVSIPIAFLLDIMHFGCGYESSNAICPLSHTRGISSSQHARNAGRQFNFKCFMNDLFSIISSCDGIAYSVLYISCGSASFCLSVYQFIEWNAKLTEN